MGKSNVDLTSSQWNDIIFEGKNKDFGAYQMRRKSDRRHNLAVIFTLIGLVIVALLIWFLSLYNDWQAERAEAEAKAKAEAMMAAQLQEEVEEQPEEQEEQKYEQPEVEVKEEVVETVRETAIAIVEEVKEENKVRENEDKLEDNTVVSTKTQEGNTDDVDKVKIDNSKKEIVGTAPPPPPPKIEEKKPEPEKIFTAVEQQAQFPGGQAALMKFLNNNLKYPERAQQNDIEGRVTVRFVVNADGSIEQVSIAKGVDKDLDAEAVRVVKKMPKWQPAKNNGVTVRSYFMLPVVFKLQR